MSDEVPEEVVVGRHASGIVLEEGLNTSTARNYCANCKRNIHCHVVIDKKSGEAEIKMTCKNDDCECKCRTHYACKRCGYLHPYGTECNKTEEQRVPNPEADKAFEKLMKNWREKDE